MTERRLLRAFFALLLCAQQGSASARAPRTGDLDPTFGGDGVAAVDLPGVDLAYAGAVQADGKLVLAGVADDALAVVRFTAAGDLDRTFGWGGVNLVAVGDVTTAGSVRVGPDGSIYLAGWSWDARDRSDSELVDGWAAFALDRVRLVLVKLTPRGVLDHSFGDAGVVTTEPGALQPIDDVEIDTVITPEGAVVVLALRGVSAGWYGFGGGAVLARFTADGRADASFGIGGVAPAGPPGVVPYPTALALQPDGRLVVGSTWLEPALILHAPPSADLLVSRHLPNGMPDTTFGTGGVVRRDLGGGADVMADLAMDRTGRILVFGDTVESRLEFASDPSSPTLGWSPFVLRLLPDGTEDRAFGQNGVTILDDPSLGLVFAGTGTVQRDGRVLLTALSIRTNRPTTQLLRLGSDGRLDRAFGSVTLPLRATTNLSVTGHRVLAGGFLREDRRGVPDTIAAAAVVVGP